MRRLALALLAAWCALADANGRAPATSTITFDPHDPQRIVAGMTFGVLISHDAGRTWQWICEAAFPYSGIYDPAFLPSSSGALFATTLQGLKVSRDGCGFTAAPVKATCDGPKTDPCYERVFLSNLVADGSAMIATASSPYDSRIYRSSDDGHTFAVASAPSPVADEYWQSIAVAPSNAKRVYLAGYRFTKQCDEHSDNAGSACRINSSCTGSGTGAAMPKCTTVKVLAMFRSDDAGATWSAISLDGLELAQNATINLAGIDPRDADRLYVRVSGSGDGLFESAHGGAGWAKIFATDDPRGLVALVRGDGSVVVATQAAAFVSPPGATRSDYASSKWAALANPPHINCLAEQPETHDVWVCTANGSDGAGMMKTHDLATWAPVLAFADIAGPVSCGSGVAPELQCVAPYDDLPSSWCCLVEQLGIEHNPVACTGAYACKQAAKPEPPAAPVAKPAAAKRSGGCCDASGEPSLVIGAIVVALFALSRASRSRRRPCPSSRPIPSRA